MAELETVLATVRSRISRYARSGIGEQDTKATLIVPVLKALGWDVEDLEDVKLEYRRRSSDNPVDYALFLLREPTLFIEAKALGTGLDDHRWANQVLAYATVAGVGWVALTDGNDWRLYNSHALVPVEQKLFRTVRLADPDRAAADTLALLSKAALADKVIEQLWKIEIVDRRMKIELDRLLGSEPPDDFVRYLHRRIGELPLGDVRASLARARVTVDYPAPTRPPRDAPEPGDAPSGVTLAHLIAAGLVRVPQAVERTYRRTRVTATIEAADRIVVDGAAYDSLSTAAAMARKAVLGGPAGTRAPSTNGWTFWQVRGADGRLVTLDDLRGHDRVRPAGRDGRRGHRER